VSDEVRLLSSKTDQMSDRIQQLKRFNLFSAAFGSLIRDNFSNIIGNGSSKGALIGYTIIDQNKFSISGFGRIDYLLEDEWKINDVLSVTVEGYEVVAGAMGKYDVNPNFSVFATGKVVPLSDMTIEFERVGDSDIERKDMFGLQAGVIFDKDAWFVRGQYDTGMENGFGVSGGIKF